MSSNQKLNLGWNKIILNIQWIFSKYFVRYNNSSSIVHPCSWKWEKWISVELVVFICVRIIMLKVVCQEIMQTFILCWLYGFVRRQILIINNGCLYVYRHSKNLYTKPAVIKLLIYTKLHKKTKHSSLNQNAFFYKRAIVSTLPFKNDSCFNKDLYNFF